MARNFLLTGFGPFLNVDDNPSGKLAEALNGTLLKTKHGSVQICGKVLAVRYDSCAAETLLAARQIDAIGILGMGVARSATEPHVERTGHAACDGVTKDADGQTRASLGTIAQYQSTHSAALATALGVTLSDDAGAYVCNAWMYGVLAGLQPPAKALPAAFLHVISEGFPADALAAGLTLWINGF